MENQIILYENVEGKVTIKVTFQDDTFWLPQKAIATLFGVEIPAISKHLANIYETGELVKEATISIWETVQMEGNRAYPSDLDKEIKKLKNTSSINDV